MKTCRRRPGLLDYLMTIAVSAAAAPPQTFFYGGQAVIEGVLMRGPHHYAVAARTREGNIVVCREMLNSRIYTSSLWRRPFFRGVAGLVEMLHLGMRALRWSANVQLGDDIELTPRAMRLTVGFSVIFALLLFIGAPALIGQWVHPGQSLLGPAHTSVSMYTILTEGAARAAIILGYLLVIGMIPSIGRLFAYHGAEHKAINCLESGADVVVANVRSCSRLHPRCGTGFLVVVALASIIVFIPLAVFPLLVRIGLQILLVPVVAAVAYEGIRGLAKIRYTLVGRVLLVPVLAAQLLSTRQPDDSQIEVSIAALDAARGAEGETVSEQHDPSALSGGSQPVEN